MPEKGRLLPLALAGGFVVLMAGLGAVLFMLRPRPVPTPSPVATRVAPPPAVAPKEGSIGAQLHLDEDDDLVVFGLIPGSPADRAGLKMGDVILAVDGTDVDGKSMPEIIGLFRGPAGSPVRVRLTREDAPPIDLTIPRE